MTQLLKFLDAHQQWLQNILIPLLASYVTFRLCFRAKKDLAREALARDLEGAVLLVCDSNDLDVLAESLWALTAILYDNPALLKIADNKLVYDNWIKPHRRAGAIILPASITASEIEAMRQQVAKMRVR